MMQSAGRHPWGWLILATSTSTLICCALPILLVSLGLGAVAASMFANLPFLVTLAHYKTWLFAGSAVLLGAAFWASLRTGRQCPGDPDLASKCAAANRWNRRLLVVSAAIWVIGFAAAYLSLPMLALIRRMAG